MKIIGITGASGAGKSTVCAELERMGAYVADADKIAHEVCARGGAAFDELSAEFGEEIIGDNGEINRKALGKIVFSDKERLKKLNEITHKHVYSELMRRISECRADIMIIDIPLLFEEGSPINYDLTVAVTAGRETRLERIILRDNISRDAAEARIKNQMSDSEYARLADLCVKNDNGTDAAELAAVIVSAVSNNVRSSKTSDPA